MNKPFSFLLYIATLASFFLSSITVALPTDSSQDLLLEAESLVYDDPLGTITYSGNVLMQQGSMKILADEVIIHGNKEGASKVIANGTPAQFQQTPNINQSPVHARANELEYSVSTKSLLLQGNATLEQEGTSLSGNKIEYDVQKSVVKADSINDNDPTIKKRVRMVIPPQIIDASPE